jgi:hypothetical protein
VKGYTTREAAIEHEPEVVEDKVVVIFDDDEDGWYVTRTTVTRRTIEVTERHTSTKKFAAYPDAATAAEEHGLPVYVAGDNRALAELEAREAAEKDADAKAIAAARRARRAALAVAAEEAAAAARAAEEEG